MQSGDFAYHPPRTARQVNRREPDSSGAISNRPRAGPKLPDGVVHEPMAFGLSSYLSVDCSSTGEAAYSSLKAIAGSVRAARRAGAQQARAAVSNSSAATPA